MGITKTTNMSNVEAREVDFVTRFAQSWQALQEILGITRPIKKTPGTKLVSYTANSVNGLESSPAEGVDITPTTFEVEPVAYGDVTVEKYSKAVTVEAVAKYGAAVAVEKTDDAFLNELIGSVLDRFYTFVQTGTLTGTEADFQMAVAMANGKVIDKFKKMRKGISGVATIVNTLDAYRYLGAATLSIQNAFGIQYVQDFLGAKVMILSSEIPSGKVIATAVDNIDLYFIDPGDSDFAKLGLQYTTDGETNLIGFHAEGNYKNATGESYALLGMKLWAEYLDGVAVITVGNGTNEGTGTGTGGTGTGA